MNKAVNTANRLNRGLPALLAMGGSLAALPAHALQLGDLSVQSKLGEPLRASIAFALSPNEQISGSCISLRQGRTASGLPNIGNATLSVANGSIQLTGRTPIREPMMAAYVVVNCPYTANISREYMLFVDPAMPAYEAPVVTQQTAPASSPVLVTPSARIVAPRPAQAAPSNRPTPSTAPAPTSASQINGTEYRVMPGDDLGSIVSRIKNRSMSLWPAVNAIFDANPQAFIDSDPNRLKAGSLLTIPSLDGTPAVVSASQAESVAAPTAVTSVQPVAEPVVDTVDAGTATGDTTADLQPSVDRNFDNPFVVPEGNATTETIPDTTLESPTTVSASPNVATASIDNTTNIVTTPASSSTSNWLLWLVGGGIGLLVALLLFTRRFRGSVDSTPLSAVVATPQRRATDVDTEQVEAVSIDFDLSDDSPTTENLALDADLAIGTGLDQGTEIEVKETFAFAPGQEIDVELPFEPVANAEDDTDMMEALRTDERPALNVDALADADDDYDMSVIVDATQMPRPEDATKYDLKAVEVEAIEPVETTDSYTINKEVDYHILEQDYEDELTATQALNEEIARAAMDLAERMDDGTDSDQTAALPLATVTELDVTAQMPARNDDHSDADATMENEVVTEKIRRDDETVEMPVKSGKNG